MSDSPISSLPCPPLSSPFVSSVVSDSPSRAFKKRHHHSLKSSRIPCDGDVETESESDSSVLKPDKKRIHPAENIEIIQLSRELQQFQVTTTAAATASSISVAASSSSSSVRVSLVSAVSLSTCSTPSQDEETNKETQTDNPNQLFNTSPLLTGIAPVFVSNHRDPVSYPDCDIPSGAANDGLSSHSRVSVLDLEPVEPRFDEFDFLVLPSKSRSGIEEDLEIVMNSFHLQGNHTQSDRMPYIA